MKSRPFFWGSICGVGGGAALGLIGLFLFAFIASDDSPSLDETDTSETTSADPLPLDVSKFPEDLAKTSLPLFKQALIYSLRTASFDQILELFNQTLSQPSSYYHQYTQRALIEILASIDPIATLNAVWFLSYSLRLELVPITYSEWASQDPEEALKSAAQQSIHMRRLAIRAIVSSIQAPVSSDFLELSESLAVDGLVNEIIAEVATKDLMQTSPKAAFDLVFSDNVDDVRQESLLSEVIEKWMLDPDDEDFSILFNSFRDEYAQMDGTNSRAKLMFFNLLDQIVQVDPHRIWQLNLSTESDLQSRLNFYISMVWGRLDPQAALQAIAEIEGSEYYEESYQRVWREWAAVEPIYVLQNLQQVQPELRADLIATAVMNLVRQDNVDQALSSIDQMHDQGENVARAVRFLVNAWVERDAAATTDWLVTTDTINDTLRKDILDGLIPVLANTDPQRAYQLAVKYGDSDMLERMFDPRFTLEMRVLDSIAKRGDFEGAKELLQTVDGSLIVAAYSTIGVSLIMYGKINEVLALGEQLSGADQTEYFESLTIRWIQWRPDELFEYIGSLPTLESQQAIALILLDERFGYQDEMSEDEISYLEFLVSDLETP
ncbi:MAG: hypothetical protein F4W92_08635 [Gammaproteobacteria bacterium]|nr:hypothetical protein [Gammaproteobacteria bacterium]